MTGRQRKQSDVLSVLPRRQVWDAVTGAELRTLEHGHVVRSVDFSHRGGLLATGGQDKKLRIFDTGALDAPPRVIAHPDKIRQVVWGADDATVFTGSEEGVLRAWDAAAAADGVAAAAPRRELRLEGGAAIMDLELSPNGEILTVAAGSAVLFVDAASLELRRRYALPFQVEAASLHPLHGRAFLAGGSDCVVHVYDTATGEELAAHKGHHGTVHCVRFAPDGATFVSGADDATLRIQRFDAGGGKAPSPPPTQQLQQAAAAPLAQCAQ
jgi:serine-threonine kinase receptor-associated protein